MLPHPGITVYSPPWPFQLLFTGGLPGLWWCALLYSICQLHHLPLSFHLIFCSASPMTNNTAFPQGKSCLGTWPNPSYKKYTKCFFEIIPVTGNQLAFTAQLQACLSGGCCNRLISQQPVGSGKGSAALAAPLPRSPPLPGTRVRCAPPCGTSSEPCHGTPGLCTLPAPLGWAPGTPRGFGAQLPRAQLRCRRSRSCGAATEAAERPSGCWAAAVCNRRPRISSYSNWAVTLEAVKLRAVKLWPLLSP